MSEFALYLRLGLSHIADLQGFDHILFVTALTAAHPMAEWRRLALLVTAFTVGHSLTLVLATLDVVRIPSALVEALIPVTILVTAGVAVATVVSGRDRSAPIGARYALAAGFGLVHGLGFSSFLRALLGAEDSLLLPLFAFNVGLEVGQLAIVAVVLALGAAAARVISRRAWTLLTAGATGGPALFLLFQRLPALTSH